MPPEVELEAHDMKAKKGYKEKDVTFYTRPVCVFRAWFFNLGHGNNSRHKPFAATEPTRGDVKKGLHPSLVQVMMSGTPEGVDAGCGSAPLAILRTSILNTQAMRVF